MKRWMTMLILVAALLTASCGLKVRFPTLGYVGHTTAVAMPPTELPTDLSAELSR